MLKALREGLRRACETCRSGTKLLWDEVDRFDRACSNDWDLWRALPEETQRLYREGARLFREDRAAGLALLEQAAARGDPIAMVQAAKCHWHGTGTAPDRERAERFFIEARNVGSWSATIELAALACRRRDMETCFAILKEGVRADYTGAMFWLASYRYRERPGGRTAREILPILETALERGHPGARWLMARLLMRGRLGVSRLGEGWRMCMALWPELERTAAGRAEPDRSAPQPG